jgi:prevent-host-death family protein
MVCSMRTVSARDANQGFSKLLGEVEAGEEIVITRRGKPVAVLAPHRKPVMTPARVLAIKRLRAFMTKGLPWGRYLRSYARDEMHER